MKKNLLQQYENENLFLVELPTFFQFVFTFPLELTKQNLIFFFGLFIQFFRNQNKKILPGPK